MPYVQAAHRASINSVHNLFSTQDCGGVGGGGGARWVYSLMSGAVDASTWRQEMTPECRVPPSRMGVIVVLHNRDI